MTNTNYITNYLKQLPLEMQQLSRTIRSGYFCADEYNANLCANLVLRGIKTATCSLKYSYELESEPLPQVGDWQVVTQWDGTPVCIIEVTDVSTCPFNQVSAEFAFCEGEGDRSLADWRKAHKAFFDEECQQQNIIFNEDMLLVLKRFKVIFPKNS